MTFGDRSIHIVQIVSSIEAEAAGPSYSVPSLARALQQAGSTVELFTLGKPGVSEAMGVPHRKFERAFRSAFALVKLGVSLPMRTALAAAAPQTDIFHTHGLWMMPNVYPSAVAGDARLKVVLSPRGMLSPAALKYSRRAKTLFWALAQGSAARRVDLFHATSKQEMDDIRAFGLTQPIAVIPNGIDVPANRWPKKTASQRSVLFLGRLHPIKKVDDLIAVWAKLEPEFPDWQLDVQGPGEAAYVDFLKQKLVSHGLVRCKIGNGLYGAEKEKAYSLASLYVLPSESENFGMTIAESLAVGTPVIATRGAPWSGLVDNDCGWWIEHGQQALEQCLRTAMSTPLPELITMGARGREWMSRDFSWYAIGRDMTSAYRWIQGDGAKPDFVYL